MQAERLRIVSDVNPFGAGEAIKEMTFDSYAPFPWMAPPAPGKYGAVYEIRTYRLKHGGLHPTIAAWEAAMVERGKFSPLTLAIYALDGAPRFTHIWPYASLERSRRGARGFGRRRRLAAEERTGLADRRHALDHRPARAVLAARVRPMSRLLSMAYLDRRGA